MIILLRIVCTVGYDVTITSANSIAVSLSRDTRDQYTALLLAEGFQIGCVFIEYGLFNTTNFILNIIYTIWYNFDTVLYQFLETGTSDRRLIGIV